MARSTSMLVSVRRAASVVAVVLAVTLVAVLSLVIGVVVHLDLAVARAAVRDITNAVLAQTFEGRITLGDVEEISPRRVAVRSFTADTPDARRVLTVDGVTIGRGWVGRLVRAAGGAELELPPVRVDDLVVDVSADAGESGLARAFAMRKKSSEPKPPKPKTAASGIVLREVEVAHAHVRGDLGSGVALDLDVSDLSADVVAREGELAIHVDAVDLKEAGLAGAPANVHADAHLRLTTDDAGDHVSLWTRLRGTLGALPVDAHAAIVDGVVSARVELSRVGPAELAPWTREVPLQQPVRVTATASGELPHLALAADLELPRTGPATTPGRVTVRGALFVGGDERLPEIFADVLARGVDARIVGRESTAIDADARIRVRLDGSASEVIGYVRVHRSTIGVEHLGPLEGTVRAGALGVDAAFRLDEEGAPTDLSAQYRMGDTGVMFASRTEADLARASRLQALLGPSGPARGTGRVHVEGSYVGGELDVSTRAELHHVRLPAQKIDAAHVVVNGRVAGKPEALSLDADLHGGGLKVDNEEVSTFAVTARGPIREPVVIARAKAGERDVALVAKVDTKRQRATGVKLDVTLGNATVSTRVDSVSASSGGLALDGIAVGGLGDDVTGGLRIVGGEVFGKLSGRRIDLGAVSRVVGLPFRLNGTVDLDVDLQPDGVGRKGFVSAKIRDAGYLVINGVNADLRADFDGQNVAPSAELRLVQPTVRQGSTDVCGGTIAAVRLSDAEGSLQGALLDPAAWSEVTGAMRVRVEDVKLQCVAEVWQQFNPVRDLPFRRLEGVLNATAVISRQARDRFVSLGDLNVSTTALVFQPREEKGQPEAATSDQLDLVVFGALDGTTGHTDVGIHLVETAKRTDLARLGVSAELDLPALWAGGKLAKRALLDTKVSASLRTKRGSASRWAALPDPVRSQLVDVDGDVEVTGFVEGTVRDPSVALRFRAWDLGSSWGLPTDVDVLANYHGGTARLDAFVRREGADVATASGELHGDLVARVAGDATDDKLTGWLSANLEALPLETLPPLAKAGVSGMVTGHVRVEGLGTKPSVSVHLAAPELKLGRIRFVGVDVAIEPVPVFDGMFVLNASLPLERRGGLTVQAYGSLAWQDKFLPSPNTDMPAGVHVVAKQFPLAALEPALDGIASRVDGHLHGDMRLRYRDLDGAKAAVDINMRIIDGEVHLPGQELTGIGATMKSRKGSSIVQVQKITVSSHQGKATGQMNARLDGLDLKDVTGTLTALPESPMPLSFQGVPLGTASGTLAVHYERGAPDRLQLSVAGLKLKLPAAATSSVQGLDDHPDVTVSLPLGPPPPEESEAAGERKVQVSVALNEAELELGQARIVLSTTTPITIQADGKLSGEIEVVGGNLNLLGKNFVFDRGVVRLRPEDETNPYVNVTARWTAGDGTIVYVDYVGLVKGLSQDKIRFRSEPARSSQEILALILVGDAALGTDRAANLTRGIAAAQFNALLGDIAPGLSTSFATDKGYIGTTLSYELSESITASATVEQQEGGGSTETTSNSDTGSARTSVSIDWRFLPNWLIRGTIGVGEQAASGLELLYQFRY